MTLGSEIAISNALILERKRIVRHLQGLAKKSLELMHQCQDEAVDDINATVHSAQSLAYHDAAKAIEELEHLKEVT